MSASDTTSDTTVSDVTTPRYIAAPPAVFSKSSLRARVGNRTLVLRTLVLHGSPGETLVGRDDTLGPETPPPLTPCRPPPRANPSTVAMAIRSMLEPASRVL